MKIISVAGKIIGVAVGLVMAGILLPIGLTAIADAVLTNVSDSVVTVFTLVLPIMAIIGVALYFIPDSL